MPTMTKQKGPSDGQKHWARTGGHKTKEQVKAEAKRKAKAKRQAAAKKKQKTEDRRKAVASGWDNLGEPRKRRSVRAIPTAFESNRRHH